MLTITFSKPMHACDTKIAITCICNIVKNFFCMHVHVCDITVIPITCNTDTFTITCGMKAPM